MRIQSLPSTETQKLTLSLAANVATRFPGAAGMLFLLPVLHTRLGTSGYSILFTSLALGTSASFMLGGFNVVGRRYVGEAYSKGEVSGEADAVVSLIAVNFGALLIAGLGIVAFVLVRGLGTSAVIVALFTAIAGFANTFDNVRASYNEHYVTALLQLCLQTILYSIAFMVPAIQENLVLASFVLQGHLVLASIISFGLLLRRRPYLLVGRPTRFRDVSKQGALIGVADGVLMASLSGAVVWLQAYATPETVAWLATMTRLFMTFLTPVLLLLLPLSSYVRMVWVATSQSSRKGIAHGLFLAGLLYGSFVAIAMWIVEETYVEGSLGLKIHENAWTEVSMFVLFAGIVSYKSYSSLSYVVTDASSLSRSILLVCLISVFAALASRVFDPTALGQLGVFAGLSGIGLVVAMVRDVRRLSLRAIVA